MPYTNGSGGYYIPKAYSARTPVAGRTTANPSATPGSGQNILKQLDYTSQRPSDPLSPLAYRQFNRESGVPGSVYNNPFEFTTDYEKMVAAARGQGVQQTQPIWPQNNAPGSGNRGGGGGGGGGGATGIDQATFDWLMAQLQNKPLTIGYRPLDLPNPDQYMKWDPSQYNVAREGVASGIQGIQQRANSAYDVAQGMLDAYRNPYAAGPQQTNPNYLEQFAGMAQANDAMGQLNQTVGEGAQADRAFANVYALMNANEQARQAANYRALAGDRRTTEQNLGIEGNALNLGVNMAEAKGKSSFDTALQKAMWDTATQEAMGNYTRQNEVEAANAGTLNSWQQNVLNQILGLVSSKATGTKLPGDMSWLSLIAPGINVQGGSGPVPTGV